MKNQGNIESRPPVNYGRLLCGQMLDGNALGRADHELTITKRLKAIHLQALARVVNAGDEGTVISCANMSKLADATEDLSFWKIVRRRLDTDYPDEPKGWIYTWTEAARYLSLLVDVQPEEGKTAFVTVVAQCDALGLTAFGKEKLAVKQEAG